MTAGMFDDHDQIPEDPAIYQYKKMVDVRQPDSRQVDFRRAASWSDFRSCDPRGYTAPDGTPFEEETIPNNGMVLPQRTVSMVVNPRDLLIHDEEECRSHSSEGNECWEQWANAAQEVRRNSLDAWYPRGNSWRSEKRRSSYMESLNNAYGGMNWNDNGTAQPPNLVMMLEMQQQQDARQLQVFLNQQQTQHGAKQQFQQCQPMHYGPQMDGLGSQGQVLCQFEAQQFSHQNQQINQTQPQHKLQLQHLQLQPIQQQQQFQQTAQELSPLKRLMSKTNIRNGPQVHFEDQMGWNRGQMLQGNQLPKGTYVPAAMESLQQLQHMQNQQQLELFQLQQQHQQQQANLQLQQQQQKQQHQQHPQHQQMTLQMQEQAHRQQLPHSYLPQVNFVSHQQYPEEQYGMQSQLSMDYNRRNPNQPKQVQRIEQRQLRAQKSQFPYPLLMTNDWKNFCRDFMPEMQHSPTSSSSQGMGLQLSHTQEFYPDARFLEIFLTVDESVRKSNPVEVVLHGLIEFGPVEIIRTCTNKNVSKWQRRHQRTVLVQMFTAEAAMHIFEQGTIEAGQCTMKVMGPPQPAMLSVTCDNVCLFAYEVHRLSDADLLQILRKVVNGVSIMKAKKRVERGLQFDSVEEARICISTLQKPLLENFNVLLYAYSNGTDDQEPTSYSSTA